jgi:hypothetical protein
MQDAADHVDDRVVVPVDGRIDLTRLVGGDMGFDASVELLVEDPGARVSPGSSWSCFGRGGGR